MKLAQQTNQVSWQRTARAVLMLMLLQIFSPVAFSLTSEASSGGYFANICTTQGYQKLWIDAGEDNQPVNLSSTHCPYCLSAELNNLDVNVGTGFVLPVVNHTLSNFSSQQLFVALESGYQSLSIRAPPV